MRLSDVFEIIEPICGIESQLRAPGSTGRRPATIPTVEKAKQRIKTLLYSAEHKTSDAEIYGVRGQLAYWSCLLNLLDAADLVGEDYLPEVSVPVFSPTDDVYTACVRLEEFGQTVLIKAREARKGCAV